MGGEAAVVVGAMGVAVAWHVAGKGGHGEPPVVAVVLSGQLMHHAQAGPTMHHAPARRIGSTFGGGGGCPRTSVIASRARSINDRSWRAMQVVEVGRQRPQLAHETGHALQSADRDALARPCRRGPCRVESVQDWVDQCDIPARPCQSALRQA